MAIADKARANSWSANRRRRGLAVLETRVVAGSGGGPDKTILNSPRFLWSAGYETLCVYMRPPGDPRFESLRQKARIWQAPLIEVDDRFMDGFTRRAARRSITGSTASACRAMKGSSASHRTCSKKASLVECRVSAAP